MRILITGGDGFVGREFQRQLAGNDITVVDLKSGIDCREWFKSHREQYDLVVHLAAIVGGRLTIEGDPLAVASDLAIDSDMFNWAVHTSQPRIVYFSSSAAYPINLQTPDIKVLLKETDVATDTMSMPDMTYGWAKLTGEVIADYARKQGGCKVFVFRPFSGYGTDQDLDYPFPSLIARGVRKDDPFMVWGDGTQTRDFIHMRDVVKGVLTVVDHEFEGPINLCTGIRTSFNELAEMVMEEAGYRGKITHDGSKPVGCHHRVGDPTLMNQFYEPQIELREGIRMALKGVL